MGGTRRLLRYLPRNRAGDTVWSILYFLAHRYRPPRIRRPRTFTEHLFAMRVSHTLASPLRRMLSDKLLAKEYVKERIGAQYCVPALAVLRTHEEIDSFAFPDECVVKPSHMSGRVQLKRERGDPIDRARLHRALDFDYSDEWREANYRGIARGIVVEPFVFGGGWVPSDIKVFCFFGEPKLIMVVLDRFGASSQRLYTPAWEPLSAVYSSSRPGRIEAAPANLAEMLDVCRRLAQGMDFIRVDLYSNGAAVKVGEFTILPGAGLHYPALAPHAADVAAGALFCDPHASASRVFRPFLAHPSHQQPGPAGGPAVVPKSDPRPTPSAPHPSLQELSLAESRSA